MTADRIFDVPLDQIEISRNIRASINPVAAQAMARSFKAKGQLHPADIVPGGRKPYSLIDGVHRYEAKRLLGESTLLCHLHEKPLSDGERIEHQLIANALRFDLRVMEKAKAIEELIERTRLSHSEVADRIGMSNCGVAKTLKLLTLAEKVQEMVAGGLLAWSTAYEITPLEDPAAQIEIASQAVSQRLTRDAVIELVKRRLSPAVPGGPMTAEPSPTEETPKAAGNAQQLRRFKTTWGDVGIAVSAVSLTPDAFIDALTKMLAAARKLRSRHLADDAFFRALRTSKGT